MRSYVFTPLKRQVLDGWLNNKLTLKETCLQNVLSKVRLFRDLAEDITLYRKVCRRLAEKKNRVMT